MPRYGVAAAAVVALMLGVPGAGATGSSSPDRHVTTLQAEPGPSYRISTTETVTGYGGGTLDFPSCDDCTKAIDLPFPVTFFGETYNSVVISSNGNLQFTGNSNSYGSTCLPNADFGAAIMPFSRDLRTTGTGDTILTGTSTHMPSGVRTFMVEWQVHYVVSASAATFRVLFFDNSHRIQVMYDSSSDDGVSAVAGLQASATGPVVEFSCHTPELFDNRTVTYIPTWPVTVELSGAGSGTVTSSPAGLACGATCTAQFDEGHAVALFASPAEGSVFEGWSGAGCSGTGACGLVADTTRTVTASFSLEGTGGSPSCRGFQDDPRAQIVGTSGDDVLTGTPGVDIICGLEGSDEVRGLAGPDLLLGGGGNDLLVGGAGRDVAKGGSGNDRMLGSAGNDRLVGGKGRDVAKGGSGSDICRAETKRSC